MIDPSCNENDFDELSEVDIKNASNFDFRMAVGIGALF